MAKYEELTVGKLRVTEGNVQQHGSNGAEVGGFRLGALAFMATAETVVIAVQSTPVLLGTTTSVFAANQYENGIVKNGVVSEDHRWKVTWKGKRWARVSASIRVSPAAGGNRICQLHFMVNGVSAFAGTPISINNANQGITGFLHELEIEEGDVLGLALSNNSDTNNIVAEGSNAGLPAKLTAGFNLAESDITTTYLQAHGFWCIEA